MRFPFASVFSPQQFQKFSERNRNLKWDVSRTELLVPRPFPNLLSHLSLLLHLFGSLDKILSVFLDSSFSLNLPLPIRSISNQVSLQSLFRIHLFSHSHCYPPHPPGLTAPTLDSLSLLLTQSWCFLLKPLSHIMLLLSSRTSTVSCHSQSEKLCPISSSPHGIWHWLCWPLTVPQTREASSFCRECLSSDVHVTPIITAYKPLSLLSELFQGDPLYKDRLPDETTTLICRVHVSKSSNLSNSHQKTKEQTTLSQGCFEE